MGFLRDQEFFEGSGIGLYHFCGIRDQNLSRFWNQGSAKKLVQNGISDEKKNLPRYDPAIRRIILIVGNNYSNVDSS